MKIRLEDVPVYTLTGVKHLYKLGDMAYGEWLIFKNGEPTYFLCIFDDLYKDVRADIKEDPYLFLKEKFKREKSNYSLTQGIHGIWSSNITDKWFDLEDLPLSFLS